MKGWRSCRGTERSLSCKTASELIRNNAIYSEQDVRNFELFSAKYYSSRHEWKNDDTAPEGWMSRVSDPCLGWETGRKKESSVPAGWKKAECNNTRNVLQPVCKLDIVLLVGHTPEN